MKKVVKFSLVFGVLAVLALAVAGCTTKTSKVTVTVQDTEGNPVKNRKVFYTDLASVIIDIAAPDPTLSEDNNDMLYGETNAKGTVTFSFDLSVKKLNYYFYVFDRGSKQWKEQTVKVKRGEDYDITFEVNK